MVHGRKYGKWQNQVYHPCLLTFSPLFLVFRYIPQGLLVAKEKYLLMIQLKSKNKNYSCLPQKCPPTVHLWVFKVKDFRNVKNNWQFYIHNAFLPRHIYSLYSVWYLKKILRYKTGDLNTKSLFEANVVLSVARILYCLFDCDLCFTYINLFVGQPCLSWIWYLRWSSFSDSFHCTICLHSTNCLLSRLFHWHLCLTSCSSIHPPGYGCLLIYAVGLISWLIFSHSPCYLLIYIACLFPSPASLRSQCYFIYGRESLFSTACSLCFCHDLLLCQLIIPNIATFKVPCFSILCASLVELSSWGHLTSWSSAFFYYIHYLALNQHYIL